MTSVARAKPKRCEGGARAARERRCNGDGASLERRWSGGFRTAPQRRPGYNFGGDLVSQGSDPEDGLQDTTETVGKRPASRSELASCAAPLDQPSFTLLSLLV